MQSKFSKNIFLVILVSIFFYSILLLYFDIDVLKSLHDNYSFQNFSLAIFFILISLFIKFFRWHFYLKNVEVKINYVDSILIFNSGLAMSITPGKIGELIKIPLIKKKYKYPSSKLTAVILAERIIEFISLSILAAVGIIWYYPKFYTIVIIFLLVFLLVFVIRNTNLINLIGKTFEKFLFIKNRIDNVKETKKTLVTLFKGKCISISFFLSIFAWIFECLGYNIILNYFVTVHLFWTILSYSFAIFIGAISMMPGGIASTEGTLGYLLVNYGVSDQSAILVTLLIRFATLWFSVFLGFISIFMFTKSLKKKKKTQSII